MKKLFVFFSVLAFAECAYSQPQGSKPVKTIVILLYDGFTPLDAVGPYQVLSGIMGVQVKTVAKKKGLIQSDGALALNADYSLTEIKQADVLIVPGGFRGTYHAAQDTILTNWVKRINKTSQYTTSVCTGAWILGAAGLLNGKDATTHWYGKTILESYGAMYKTERYVKSGKIYTAAGVSAGIDMGLALLAEISGEAYAKGMQLAIEYDPQPPFYAGSPSKADPAMLKMLTQMYDDGVKRMTEEDAVKPQPKTSQSKSATKQTAKGLLQEDGIDPVCHMKVKAGSDIISIHNGKRYSFCSRMCKEAFEKEPAKFLSEE